MGVISKRKNGKNKVTRLVILDYLRFFVYDKDFRLFFRGIGELLMDFKLESGMI